MKFTVQQQKVVDADVGNLLVSAAAGSGKTSVMTERIASRILSGKMHLRNVLVMTFTNAAASNMRDKIEKKLTDGLSAETDSARRNYIAEQLAFLPTAHISTIHAFCLDVIQNFGYDARTDDGDVIIEPGFSTLDDMRRKLLLQESIEEVFSTLYEMSHAAKTGSRPDPAEKVPHERTRNSSEIAPFTLLPEEITLTGWLADFDRAIASLGNARSDVPVREWVAARHSYLRSLPAYEEWTTDKLRQMKDATTSFGTTHHAQTLMSDFFTAIQLAEPNLAQLMQILPDVQFVKDRKVNERYHAYFGDVFHVLTGIFTEAAEGLLTWNRCAAYAGMFPEGKGPSVKADDPDDVRGSFFALLPAVYEVIFYLTGKGATKDMMSSFRTPARHLFARTEEALEEDLLFMLPVASRLYEVLCLVDDRYARKKRAENAVDFPDYEHIALQLLSRPDAQKYYSGIFSEIYIDEYQDNSRIEEAIVHCFAKNNCFVVGDVKQSIYRFRHARPQLFMNRMRAYQNKTDGELLELNSNFRSRPGILHLVNHIFSQILSVSSGEIDYDAGQQLVAERESDTETAGPAAEILLVDITGAAAILSADAGASGDEPIPADVMIETETPESGGMESDITDAETLEDLGKAEKSAQAVVTKIRELVTGGGVAWGDIAILTRTNSEVALFRDQMICHGIPAEGIGESVFLSSRELMLMESLMKILDNFRQDIPLAAVMRAAFPQAGFTDSELLAIKLFPQKMQETVLFFHEAVLLMRDSAPDTLLSRKVQSFCDWIDSLRSRSMYLRVSELIETIYVETGFREQVSTLPDGGKRVMDLETFRDWANRYETGRNSGLYRFVKYIEDIREKGESPDDFDPNADERDVVHCLSIHKSKGLEFKYVFVCGLDRRFPAGQRGSRTLLSESFGIGIDYIRPDEGYFYPTHSKLAMETDEMRAELAENMRLFYVAMTRAEEKLFLVGCIARKKDGSIGKSAELLRLAQMETDEKLPAWLVQKSKSFLDLCLLGLARHAAITWDRLLSDAPDTDDGPNAVSANAEQEGAEWKLSVCTAEEAYLRANVPVTPGVPAPAPSVYPQNFTGCSDLSPEEIHLFALQIHGEYPYQDRTRIPAKMSVSEIKRRVNDYGRPEEEDEVLLPLFVPEVIGKRPVNLVVQPIEPANRRTGSALSAAEKGTLLHSVFQYLDFASLPSGAGPEDIRTALGALVSHKMIRPEMVSDIEPYFSSVSRFTSSSLCARLIAAEKDKGRGPFREIPFSITVPVGKSDMSLVQGMIDCWFIENGCAVLIDYKSDRIEGSHGQKAQVLQERYAVQLEYYAKAIEAASGLCVTERIIWLIPDGLSFSLEGPGKNP